MYLQQSTRRAKSERSRFCNLLGDRSTRKLWSTGFSELFEGAGSKVTRFDPTASWEIGLGIPTPTYRNTCPGRPHFAVKTNDLTDLQRYVVSPKTAGASQKYTPSIVHLRVTAGTETVKGAGPMQVTDIR